jgi:hypothetical protein
MGLLPDEPTIAIPGTTVEVEGEKKAATACTEYTKYARYTLDLKEAYRTRTTQNRTWIYVAGIMGLGVAAASGALAAATAVAAGTLALLAISGGVAAASFATIDNTELANVYNMAANQLGTALADAEAEVIQDNSEKNCAAQLAHLVTAVSEARNTLETARTNSAAGALIRAQAGQQAIKDIIAAQQDANPTQVTLNAAITQIDGKDEITVDIPAGGKLVTLTVANAQLDKVATKDIKVAIGSKENLPIDGIPNKKGEFTYEVKVQVPKTAPGSDKEYAPALVVGKSKQRIPSNAKLVLRYP